MARLGMGEGLRPFMLANLLSHTLLGCVDGEFLISGIVGRYDPDKRVLHLVNAGHPAPRLVRDGLVEVVRGEGHPPIGSVRTHRYTEAALELRSGDQVLFFSDGFSEATNSRGEELGERELQRVAEVYAEGGPAAIRNALQALVLEHTGDLSAVDDDLTLLILSVA
ncbi:MAG: serine/threonine-protein phosphatase, partial [Myxococcales bacterium]|nr:serine/threonine-protein phosphatase [Myxococcales bacterium]